VCIYSVLGGGVRRLCVWCGGGVCGVRCDVVFNLSFVWYTQFYRMYGKTGILWLGVVLCLCVWCCGCVWCCVCVWCCGCVVVCVVVRCGGVCGGALWCDVCCCVGGVWWWCMWWCVAV
jgi:hypothetical protein